MLKHGPFAHSSNSFTGVINFKCFSCCIWLIFLLATLFSQFRSLIWICPVGHKVSIYLGRQSHFHHNFHLVGRPVSDGELTMAGGEELFSYTHTPKRRDSIVQYQSILLHCIGISVTFSSMWYAGMGCLHVFFSFLVNGFGCFIIWWMGNFQHQTCVISVIWYNSPYIVIDQCWNGIVVQSKIIVILS